jgi:hypothetical protein
MDPLVGPKAISDQEPKPIPRSSALAINALAFGRLSLGFACLVAPTFTLSLFKFPIPANMTLIPRMFAGREIVIGEWTRSVKEEDKNATEGGRRELKRGMRLNTLVDALDLAAVGYGVSRLADPCARSVLTMLAGGDGNHRPVARRTACRRSAYVHGV